MGNYRGNNYRAAIVTAQNAINDYPNSQYKEDYSIIIVRAKYKEAINSVQEKLKQRCEDALDECYYFSQEYPEDDEILDVFRGRWNSCGEKDSFKTV